MTPQTGCYVKRRRCVWDVGRELAATFVDFGENTANSRYFNTSVYSEGEINTAAAELLSLPLSSVPREERINNIMMMAHPSQRSLEPPEPEPTLQPVSPSHT